MFMIIGNFDKVRINSNLYSLIVVNHQYPLGVVECSLEIADNAVYSSVEDYTVTVPEGYKFLFGIWSIAWIHSHAIPNFVFEHQFEVNVGGKMSVIKIDPNLPVTPFVPQMLCVFVKK